MGKIGVAFTGQICSLCFTTNPVSKAWTVLILPLATFRRINISGHATRFPNMLSSFELSHPRRVCLKTRCAYLERRCRRSSPTILRHGDSMHFRSGCGFDLARRIAFGCSPFAGSLSCSARDGPLSILSETDVSFLERTSFFFPALLPIATRLASMPSRLYKAQRPCFAIAVLSLLTDHRHRGRFEAGNIRNRRNHAAATVVVHSLEAITVAACSTR